MGLFWKTYHTQKSREILTVCQLQFFNILISEDSETSYTAFLWVFVQTVSGKRASDTFVKLLEAHSVRFYR